MKTKFEYDREIQDLIAHKFLNVMIPVMFIAAFISMAQGLILHVELSRLMVSILIFGIATITMSIRRVWKHHSAVTFLMVGAVTVESLGALINGGFHTPAFTGVMIMMVLVGWFYSARVTIIYALYFFLFSILIAILTQTGILRHATEQHTLFYLFNYSALALMLIVGVVVSNRQLHKALYESKNSEEQLRDALNELVHSNENFRTSLDFFPIPIAITKSNGETTFHNHAFREHYGYTIEDLPSVDSWIETVYEDSAYRDKIIAVWREDIGDAIASGKTSRISVHNILAKDGTPRVVEVSMQPIDDQFVHVLNDITERDSQQRKHQQLSEQLHQSQKMEAVGQLAGGVAHDFNNALAGIIGAVELLKMGGTTEEELEQYCDLILTAAGRAGSLTKKLMSFSRKDTKISTNTDIMNVIKDTTDILAHTINKNIKVSVKKGASDTVILGEDSLLENAFMNIGINASHAMPDGGELSFVVENIEFDAEYCEMSPFEIKPGNYVEIAIRDTGTGMTPEVQSRIFEPFFTTKASGKGTGLGMVAVYRTVQEHRGMITINSELGRGTVFHIYLPLSSGSALKVKEAEKVSLGTGTILVIDDEELIRITARTMLINLGYKVICAENGLEGVTLFAEMGQQIDLILLDMIMPVMGGRDAFIKLREMNPDIPVIIVSGFAKEGDVEALTELGISGFLHKPFRRAELAGIVASVLESRYGEKHETKN